MTPTTDDMNRGEEQARAHEARRQRLANAIVVIAGNGDE